MIHHTSRCSDNQLYAALQRADLLHDLLPAVDRQHLDAVHIIRQIADLLRYLYGKLSGRTQYDRL